MRIHSTLLVIAAGLCWNSRTGPHVAAAASAETIVVEEDHPLLNDPDLLGAMEIFMGMSPKEREETIHDLMEAAGDDPKQRAEMKMLINKLPELDEEALKNSPDGMHSNLNQMVKDDEFAKAKQNARHQLDGTSWEFFWENQAAILEATIQSGEIRPREAALFKTDIHAWEQQLRIIWEDVAKKQE